MTFDTAEKSVQSGTPRELYTFELSGGTYRLTSSNEDVTIGGNVYRATAGLSRGNVAEAPLGDETHPTVTLPVTHAVAADLLANGIPPRRAVVTIERIHDATDTPYRVWRGGIVEVSTDDQYARLRVPSLVELAFDVEIPLARASRICQHHLYGPGCRVVRPGTGGTVVSSTTVVSVDGTEITLTSVAEADAWYDGGEITRMADGETRTILTHVGTTFVVDVPFRTLAGGNTVTFVPGCDGQVTTCRDKFANIINFGGHPDLPEVNPTTPVPKKSPNVWQQLKDAGF